LELWCELVEKLRLPLIQSGGQARLVDLKFERKSDVHGRSPAPLCGPNFAQSGLCGES